MHLNGDKLARVTVRRGDLHCNVDICVQVRGRLEELRLREVLFESVYLYL